MKHLLFSVSILLTASCSFAQTDQVNLQKYWKLRNDFREKFVKIGPLPGESLPARSLRPGECVDNYTADGTGHNQTPQGNASHGEMKWGDGMIRHGYYLGLLATEYRLLKDAGQDVTGVLNELYYALNAVNRLDLKAELEQGAAYNATFSPSLNGFYQREDIPEFFASDNWANTNLEARCVNSPHSKTNNAAHVTDPAFSFFIADNSYQNSPSSDQFSSLLLGFSLIHKLVDDVYVQPPGSENGFYVVTETKNIVYRMVNYLNEHNWMMIDVNGWPVNNGGGDVFYAAPMIFKTAKRITGHDFNADWDRRIAAFFIKNIQYCITGYGVVDNTTSGQTDACDKVINQSYWGAYPYGTVINQAYMNLGAGATAGPQNNQSTSEFQEWLAEGDLNGTYNQTIPLWVEGLNLILDAKDDGKLSGLPSPLNDMKLFEPGDGENDDATTILLSNYGVAAGNWTGSQVSSLSNVTGNRQLELINAIIRGEVAPNAKNYYQGIMNGMQPAGPYDLYGKSGGTVVWQADVNGWASEHRWTWMSIANTGGDNEDQAGIYNGLDYMLYHNLYYLLFKSQLPTYNFTEDCFCQNAPYYEEQTTDPGKLSAIQALNNKIQKLPYCTPNVFAQLNNTISTTNTVEPYFTNYASMSIFPTKFQTENSTITSAGYLKTRTRFKVCNSKTLTINTGGHMDIERRQLLSGTMQLSITVEQLS